MIYTHKLKRIVSLVLVLAMFIIDTYPLSEPVCTI